MTVGVISEALDGIGANDLAVEFRSLVGVHTSVPAAISINIGNVGVPRRRPVYPPARPSRPSPPPAEVSVAR